MDSVYEYATVEFSFTPELFEKWKGLKDKGQLKKMFESVLIQPMNQRELGRHVFEAMEKATNDRKNIGTIKIPREWAISLEISAFPMYIAKQHTAGTTLFYQGKLLD